MVDRELLILRHAKSSWRDASLDDFERPLKGRGKRDAGRVGAHFRQKGYELDLIISSPARRAVQTVELLLKGMNGTLPSVQWCPELYLAGIEEWCSRLRLVDLDAARVLIVGHNPGLEDLLLFLCKDPLQIPADGKLMPTATLAHLSLETAWSELKQNSCRLVAIQRPAELPEAPPFATSF